MSQNFGADGFRPVPCEKNYPLNPASVSFAEDAIHQARSRMMILQTLDKVPPFGGINEAFPKGSTFLK